MLDFCQFLRSPHEFITVFYSSVLDSNVLKMCFLNEKAGRDVLQDTVAPVRLDRAALTSPSAGHR